MGWRDRCQVHDSLWQPHREDLRFVMKELHQGIICRFCRTIHRGIGSVHYILPTWWSNDSNVLHVFTSALKLERFRQTIARQQLSRLRVSWVSSGIQWKPVSLGASGGSSGSNSKGGALIFLEQTWKSHFEYFLKRIESQIWKISASRGSQRSDWIHCLTGLWHCRGSCWRRTRGADLWQERRCPNLWKNTAIIWVITS